MFAVAVGALVVIFSVGQYLVCPMWYPTMCDPALATALIFGFLGLAGIIGGIGIHLEQRAKRRGHPQDTS